MFWHNFKYSLKVLLKSKILLFWTFAFPIILGLFFNMAFSDIENSEKLDIIDIAIISNEEFNDNEIFKQVFKNLSDEDNENRLFNTKYVSLDDARELLENEEVTGYVLLEDEAPKITVGSSGINETILRYVVDEIQSNSSIINDIANEELKNSVSNKNYIIDYEKIYKDVVLLVENQEVKLNNVSNDNLSYTMIEYYTLIAMSCLYGGIISMYVVNYKLANMNSVGKRTSISPISKGSMLLGSLLASYLVQLFGVLLLFLFTIFVLKVDYGSNLPLIILLDCVGSLAGLSLGVAVATLFKTNENNKLGILVAITMAGCFLSGMMGITMKYIVDTNVPFINKINPVSMITDGLYSLYYYDTLERFWFNVISLLIFSLVAFIISYRGLRRQKYDSI